jgi:hypothetical protein
MALAIRALQEIITMARAPRRRPAEAPAGVGDPDPLEFPAPVRLKATGCRPAVRSVSEGIHLIDDELSAELRRLPRWTFARALLEEVLRTKRKRDLAAAVRQLRQALANEGWLVEEDSAAAREPD